jgi:hypothetical protein
MTPEMRTTVDSLGPAFKLPLRALTAILASDGRSGVVDYAEESDDPRVKFLAVLLINTREAIDVMKAMVDLSSQPPNPSKARRLQKRLAKALAATKALVAAEPLLKQAPRAPATADGSIPAELAEWRAGLLDPSPS